MKAITKYAIEQTTDGYRVTGKEGIVADHIATIDQAETCRASWQAFGPKLSRSEYMARLKRNYRQHDEEVLN